MNPYEGVCYDGPYEGLWYVQEQPYFRAATAPKPTLSGWRDGWKPSELEAHIGVYRWSYPLKKWVFEG